MLEGGKGAMREKIEKVTHASVNLGSKTLQLDQSDEGRDPRQEDYETVPDDDELVQERRGKGKSRHATSGAKGSENEAVE